MGQFQTDPSKYSILIVDDDRVNLRILTDILETEYCIYTAKSASQALKILEEDTPDLILLDIMMPDMNGFDLLRRLRVWEPLRNTPVIFITGCINVEDEIKGFKLGAADYIKKPFSDVVVEARVKSQIRVIQQMRVIERLSKIDELTNIPNRRSYVERMEFEWMRAIRNKSPFSMIMLDADKFKIYNDTYGHQAGDALLRAMADTFQLALKRPADMVARVGGEEFSIILPDTDLKGALLIAEQIRASIECLGIPHRNSDVAPVVTVSLGVVSICPTLTDSMDHFIANCDKALYFAKSNGRNKVCDYDSMAGTD